ncbi:hypothetical protein [Paractinoplanes hotanensis]|uniref:Uncharacterized protein n=1 Tax=Paractinoplanes hotanensis TaxID=2906497 RepID=A0ABT0XWS2_9ACTN|nr:hypothetical protein [Actinoplanes hotanensis]MCM4078236.1 hypothetical protein [Actinoplanes hotanensis]
MKPLPWWVAVLIAGMGILGTLAATFLAQLGEAKRAKRAQTVEAKRRADDRLDALARERREAIRNDYREILRFVARTRLFVLEMRARLAALEDWSAHASTDAREVEDLEARAGILRRRFLDELPDIQSLVGAWAPDNLIAIFDEIGSLGPKIAAGISVALHFKFDGERLAEGTVRELGELDRLLVLLNEARDSLQREQQPDPLS